MVRDNKQPEKPHARSWTPWGPQPVQKRAHSVAAVRRLAGKVLQIGKNAGPKPASR